MKRQLTKRQKQIIRLVARGYPNAEIAQRLGLTTGTVKAHMHLILLHLDLANRGSVAAAVHRGAVL